MSVILIGCLALMFKMSQSELAPEEDQGLVFSLVTGPPTATSDQMQMYANQSFRIAHDLPEYKQMFQITGVPTTNAGIGGILLKDCGVSVATVAWCFRFSGAVCDYHDRAI